MLSAPSGVTNTAGAKAYATKLATSPTITEKRKDFAQNFPLLSKHHAQFSTEIARGNLTSDHANPPQGLHEIRVPADTCTCHHHHYIIRKPNQAKHTSLLTRNRPAPATKGNNDSARGREGGDLRGHRRRRRPGGGPSS
jgi:hypothetical protein